MKRRKAKINKKLEEITTLVDSLKEEENVRFVFSYIRMGNNLNDLKSEIISNLKEDLASAALKVVMDEKIYGNPMQIIEKSEMEELEEISKLHMFNLFNGTKKPEA